MAGWLRWPGPRPLGLGVPGRPAGSGATHPSPRATGITQAATGSGIGVPCLAHATGIPTVTQGPSIVPITPDSPVL